MQVTLKLFASLSSFLPAGARRNKVDLDVEEGVTILNLLDSHHVPREHCHLVMLNGVYHPPETRGEVTMKQGDVLAVWPPVAGG